MKDGVFMLKNCPFCGKETYDHAATKYCMYCHKDLTINGCTNKECFTYVTHEEFPKDAVCCPICGSPTVLHPVTDEDYPF